MPQDSDHTVEDLVDISAVVRRLDVPYSRLVPWAGEQRHRSYRIDDKAGRPWGWAKVERQFSPFAGIALEAQVLALVADLGVAPLLVTSGRLPRGMDFLITRHVEGQLARTCSATRFAQPLFRSLEALHASDIVLPHHEGHHLFSAHPDLAQILTEAYAAASLPLPEFSRHHPAAMDRHASAPIHGSLALDNIVVVGEQAILLDWEAARLGYPSYDVACLLGELTEEGRQDDARAVWTSAIACWPDDSAGALQWEADAWMLIRLAHQAASQRCQPKTGRHDNSPGTATAHAASTGAHVVNHAQGGGPMPATPWPEAVSVD